MEIEQSDVASKLAELESLKKSYEEFMESSAALEKELEDALAESDKKCAEANKKRQLTEEKYSILNEKYSNLTTQLLSCQDELSRSISKLNAIEHKKIELERLVDELQEMVRILEATEEDLTHKLQTVEEELIFAKADLDEMKSERFESERRLKAELTDIQAELARVETEATKAHSVSSPNNDCGDNDNNGNYQTDAIESANDELIEELELEISDLTERLEQSDQQNQQLNEEVSRLADELIQIHEKHAKENENSVALDPLANLEKSRQIEQLECDLDSTRSSLESAQCLLERVTREKDELSERLELSTATTHRLQEECDSLQNSLQHTATREIEMSNEISSLRISLANALASESSGESQIAVWQQELQQREDSIEKLNVLVSSLQQEINQLKISNQSLENQVRLSKIPTLQTPVKIAQSPRTPATVKLEDFEANVSKPPEPNTSKSQPDTERLELERELEFLRHAVAKGLAAPTPSKSSQRLQEPLQILDAAELNRRVIEDAIAAGDQERIKSLLITQISQLEATRQSNARLLQKLQSARGNIQVCCRTRPPGPTELAAQHGNQVCVDIVDDNELACYDKRTQTWKAFTFDRVWKMDCTQADVFADVEPLVLSVLDGYNTCLFAYGQTGSGKTFTMNGYGEDYGVSYRALRKIFEMLRMRAAEEEAQLQSTLFFKQARREAQQSCPSQSSDLNKNHSSNSNSSSDANTQLSPNGLTDTEQCSSPTDNSINRGHALSENVTLPDESEVEESVSFTFSVEVSMMEIYNDQVYDLLSGSGDVSVEIRQAADGTVHVPDLIQVPVNGLEDVLNVFEHGSANRATAATSLNEHSSRSHSILVVDVSTVAKGSTTRAKLFLVDLAGSERAGKSGVSGAAMKETQHINKSLSALGDVMEALDQKAKHIPYRNSKLTYLLQDSLGGNSRTMMIVTVCPTDLTLDETLFTLGFASRVRNVSLGVARRNFNAKNLEESIKVAKAEAREMRKKRAILEESVLELKKQLKKTTEKMSVQTDVRGKAIEEYKRATEAQIQQLGKSNQDLLLRLQDEKETKQRVQQELEALQKSFKKANEHIKEIQKEREKMAAVLKQREADREKERELSKEPPSLSRPAIRPFSNSNSKDNILGPPRRETLVASSVGAAMQPPRRIIPSKNETQTPESAIPDQNSGSTNSVVNMTNLIDESLDISTSPRTILSSPARSVSSGIPRMSVSTSTPANVNASTTASRSRSAARPSNSEAPTMEETRSRRGSVVSVGSTTSTQTVGTVSKTIRARTAQSFAPPTGDNARRGRIAGDAQHPPVSLSHPSSPGTSSTTGLEAIPTPTPNATAVPTSAAQLRTGIAARSKEALLRHQERMEKFRERQELEAKAANSKVSKLNS